MVEILISGGPVMIPLGALSMVAVAIIMERLWVLRRSNFLQSSTVQTLSGLLASDKFQGSIDFCHRHPGPFTDLVIALVENRHAPYEELKEILEDTGRLQLMGLQRGLPAWWMLASRRLYDCGGPWIELSTLNRDRAETQERRQRLLGWYSPPRPKVSPLTPRSRQQ